MNHKASCVDLPVASQNLGQAFSAVARYFRALHGVLSDSYPGPYRMTALGAWATSRSPHVFSFFKRTNLSRYELFLDLGSGDGLVTCIAGLFTRSIGVEIDPELCRVAQGAVRELKLEERVSFVCGNYLQMPIWKADCLYLYPDKPMHELESLLTNWKGSLLIYGLHLPPRNLLQVSKLQCGRESLVLYQNLDRFDCALF
jgi:hypothetical protein